MWKIQAKFNSSFYWSNSWGWVDEETSDSFHSGERASLSLPEAGQWVWVEDMDGMRFSGARSFVQELWT